MLALIPCEAMLDGSLEVTAERVRQSDFPHPALALPRQLLLDRIVQQRQRQSLGREISLEERSWSSTLNIAFSRGKKKPGIVGLSLPFVC